MTTTACGEVCQKLTDINNVVIKSLITSITDLLKDINNTIELSGKIDEEVLARLGKLELKLAELSALVGVGAGHTSDLRALLEMLSAGSGYVLADDKDRLRILIRRLSSAASNWSEEEKNVLVDMFENLGCYAVKTQKKIKRLYWLVASAGVVTVLAQTGAPSWIQKLFSLLVGQ